MDGTYIHLISKPYSFETSYIDFTVIDIDVLANKCKFYAVTGDLITESNVHAVKEDEVEIVEDRLSFLKDTDGFYVLRIIEDPDLDNIFYYKLEPTVLETTVEKCKYKQYLIEIEGIFFYLFYGKRRGEPHLFPVTTIREDDVEYISLYTLEKEWLSAKD
ncbi:MAG: hypothetical protein AAGG75_25640 [Bacteroidota bacterium]